MSDIMYVAYVYGGEYDEAYEEALLGSFDKVKIEQFVAEKNTRLQTRRKIKEDIFQLSQKWRETNVCPEYPKDQLVHRPSFAGYTQDQITTAMRQERKEIDGHNAKVSERHSAEVHAYHDRLKVVTTAYIDSLNLTPVEREYHIADKWDYDRPKGYEIRELKVI